MPLNLLGNANQPPFFSGLDDRTLTVSDDAQPVTAPFSVSVAQAAYNLQEGNAVGVNIPCTLTRDTEFDTPVTLALPCR